jgi:integrase
MIGLFTGARVNEVAQLYVDDVREIDGVWGLFFWKNTRGQKIKNKASIRFVPLAKPLMEAGFLDFVHDMRATGHPRLFPHLPAGTKEDGTPNGKGYGTQLSKQFGKYVKTVGVEKGSGFHCFRHTMATSLAELGIPETDIALITGHTVTGQVPVLAKHYIHIAQAATLKKRVKMLARLKPPLVLTKYTKGQFADALADPDSFHP